MSSMKHVVVAGAGIAALECVLALREHAGHATAFEHFRDFHRIMNETVVPETYR